MAAITKTLFFGDSITVGEGLLHPNEERWTALVARAQACAEINEGKGGRPASALEEFRAALKTHRTDAAINRLVIALGGNDARSPEPDIAAQVARNVGEMVDLTRATAPSWAVIICGPYNINRAHLQNKAIADLRKMNLVAINSALRTLAEAKGCPYVKYLGVVPSETLTSDGVHPAAPGHAAIGAAFLAARSEAR